MEQCANCHRSIGDLETPWLFKERTVCHECYGRLTAPPMAVAATPGSASPVAPPRSVSATTDAVAGRVIIIALLVLFILGCLSVIIAKLTAYTPQP